MHGSPGNLGTAEHTLETTGLDHLQEFCNIACTQQIFRMAQNTRFILKIFILIIKPSRCTNFSNLFVEYNSTCFGQFPLSIIGSFSLYTQQWYMSYWFADSSQAVSRLV